jgi:hypothetical protein
MNTDLLPDQKATLKFVYTNCYGDKTEVTTDLYDETIESVYSAVLSSLRGCGFAESTIQEWFGEG